MRAGRARTTWSCDDATCVAAILDGEPRLVPNEKGDLVHDPVVSFLDGCKPVARGAGEASMVPHTARTIKTAREAKGLEGGSAAKQTRLI